MIPREISHFKLTKELHKKLKRFDELCNYMKSANRDLPRSVRLYRADYVSLDSKIREESEQEFGVAQSCWRGFPIEADR